MLYSRSTRMPMRIIYDAREVGGHTVRV